MASQIQENAFDFPESNEFLMSRPLSTKPSFCMDVERNNLPQKIMYKIEN